MDFGKEDIKQLGNLIILLQKKVTFKELTAPEVLTVALVIQWLGELKEKMVKSVESLPQEEPVKSQTKQVKKKK